MTEKFVKTRFAWGGKKTRPTKKIKIKSKKRAERGSHVANIRLPLLKKRKSGIIMCKKT